MIGEELPRIVVPPPGPRSRELSERLSEVESPAFDARRRAREEASGKAQSPIVYARGVGANVFDVDGNRYVDLVAGFGALPLGHGHPAVTRALETQEGRLTLALGDVYGSEPKVELCERLAALVDEAGARVMLGLSGADAVTAALKTAALATGRPGIVAFEGAYHGLSHGPLAACGLHEGFAKPFAEQLNPHVAFAPYPLGGEPSVDASIAAVRDALRSGRIGAVLVEPLLGRGGCIEPHASFLPRLRELCDDHGALLIADEIWTGLGRTGAMLATRAAGVLADVVCLGKALGGGLPISACIGRAKVMEAWGAHGGTAIHTATHFGAPLACATALAVLRVLAEQSLPERAARVGEALSLRLRERVGERVRGVHGRGLMIGIALSGAPEALATARALLERGYLVLTGGKDGSVLTLSPALTTAEPLLDAFVEALSDALPPG